MAPTVSIIVPCYNAQDTIADAILSLLAQTETDWECILVSDDGTSYLDVLASRNIRDERIVEHPVRSNRTGTVAPRNRGFEIARGGLIADLDADDMWKPDRLARLAPLAWKFGSAQDILECFDETGVIGHSATPDGGLERLDVAGVVAFDFPFHLVVRKDVAGGTWSRFDGWAPDVVRAMRIAGNEPLAWLREPLLRYRVASGSMSQSVEGSRKIDRAYSDMLAELREGEGYGLSASDRQAAIAGIERKRALNLRHIRLAEAEADTPPFLAWILSGGDHGDLDQPVR